MATAPEAVVTVGGLGESVKAIGDKTTVVLAGAFNPAILLPQWVAIHGLGHPAGQDFQVEMLAPVGGTGQARFAFDGLAYSAGFKNFMVYVDGTQIAQSERAIVAVANILSQLPHTPVAGIGFNFGFLVEEPGAALLALMTTHDGLTDSFDGDPEVVTRRWGNTVKWEQAIVSVDCELAGGQAIVAFNFHYSTESASAAEQILRAGGVFEKHQQRAIAAAQALTGQQLEV
jgi:hypothetical protein